MYSAFQGWAEYKCGGQCWCLPHQTMYLQDSATELELRVLTGTEERGAKSGLVWNMEHGQCGHHGWRGVTSADICSSHHRTPDNGGQWTGAGRMMIGSVGVTA